mmetsp:Transcript_18251/g.28065  ORF Transcript_18251/g.28065 Transcript_18251/m.28065 type:complete len:83 (-) Transcript_18251:270-518(-)
MQSPLDVDLHPPLEEEKSREIDDQQPAEAELVFTEIDRRKSIRNQIEFSINNEQLEETKNSRRSESRELEDHFQESLKSEEA